MSDDREMLEQTRRDVERLERNERSPAGWAGLAFYGGTIGLLFVAPVIAGAYLGRWLDSLAANYSVRWTMSLIVLGIAVGAWNAWAYVSKHE